MPNEEQTYREGVNNRLNTFEVDVRNSLSRIETQVSYTNGKVRKIIIALVLMFGLLIGLGFDKAGLVLSFLGI